MNMTNSKMMHCGTLLLILIHILLRYVTITYLGTVGSLDDDWIFENPDTFCNSSLLTSPLYSFYTSSGVLPSFHLILNIKFVIK